MNKKYNYEIVKNLFKNKGYILVSKTYESVKDKLFFKCESHLSLGVQKTTLDLFLHCKNSCKGCSGEESSKRQSTNKNTIIEKCNSLGFEFLGTKCGKGKGCIVKYRCRNHPEEGVISQPWDKVKRLVVGCNKCFGRKRNLEEFLSTFENHPDIIISGEYKGLYELLDCECRKCGYTWKTSAASLKIGSGCPRCKSSHGEIEICKFLDKNNIPYFREFKFEDCVNVFKLPFDFFLPNHNMVIEYDGEQHYRPVAFGGRKIGMEKRFIQCKFRDSLKNDYCIKNNIKLVRIPYWDRENINEILTREINNN